MFRWSTSGRRPVVMLGDGLSNRTIQIVACVLACMFLLTTAVARSVIAQEAVYDPSSTAQILLSASISDDDLLWAEQPTIENPDRADVLHEIHLRWSSGL